MATTFLNHYFEARNFFNNNDTFANHFYEICCSI